MNGKIDFPDILDSRTILFVLIKLLIRKNIITQEEWGIAIKSKQKQQWDARHTF